MDRKPPVGVHRPPLPGIIDDRVLSGEATLVFDCGTGWRSSIALLLGLRARNYDGGFYRWSWDDRNPVQTEPHPPLLFPRQDPRPCRSGPTSES